MTEDGSRANICIVVPTYNDAHFLEQALESISRQSLQPRRVLVIDDGSDQAPTALCRRFPRVELISKPNGGLASARNTGLALADTRYMLFLDADDLLEAKAIEESIAVMADHPEAAFIYGANVKIDNALRRIGVPTYRPLGSRGRARMYRKALIEMPGTVVYDRARLVEAGGFDESFELCEDYEIYLRLLARHRAVSHPHLIGRYRYHESNMSHDLPRMLDWHLRALDKHRPGKGDSLGLRLSYQLGRHLAHRDYAFRAWMTKGSDAQRKRAHRWYMMRRAPFSSLQGIAKSLVWRVTPERLRRWVFRQLRGELVDPASAPD